MKLLNKTNIISQNINYRKVLQLCCFTNLWGYGYQVESHDIRNNKNIFDLPDDYGKDFDLIAAAPPCNQYTIANNRNWQTYPEYEIAVTRKCLTICQLSGKGWFIETTIGRIETFFPELKKYRAGTWQSRITTKKHTIYSNLLLLFPIQKGNISIVRTRSVKKRDAWQPDLIEDLKNCING